ncbi:MAG: DNA helicase RecQ [Caldilineales bacterium]|nr:DNA helicase RecQ [Caldilineales bacterium]MDW8316698.1 DNA helicase RecQ [Anaerolineae bacterium]
MKTKVLIVAKTRQGNGACIGGITLDQGRSVRLIPVYGEVHEGLNLEYQVGEVWEVEGEPAAAVQPPHVENFLVRRHRRLGPMSAPQQFIERHMPPRVGGPEVLYEGLLQWTAGGRLYVAQHTGVPPYSTTFWRPDQPLQRVETENRLRYRYPTPDGGRTLVFVGFQEPIETVPAGALVRVSLAHWWRPDDRPDVEPRCYVQLSGYFLAEAPANRLNRPAAASPSQTIASSTGRRPPPPVVPADPPAQAAEHSLQPLPPASPTTSPPSTSASPPSPSSRSFPSAAAHDLLKSVFGYQAFWPLQEEIISNALARRDTLAVMPTGGGKSLCYQLPALLFDGLTVVVSPLIALMQDQVDQLRSLGVPAAFLNSSLRYSEMAETRAAVGGGQVKLLYTSPETLLKPETLVLLDRSRVDCLVIDEAHCISQWGHDFRPEYRQLLPVRRRYGHAVCLAFTATATERVRRDIADQLGFAAAEVFVASFDRRNLRLSAQPRTDELGQVLGFLERRRGQPGIIYCGTRDAVDRLAAHLRDAGWPALAYHAGMEDADRRHNQRGFLRSDAAVMVATVAFGMGINKPDVRFVVHVHLPKDLESYYQEIGRAGRDGLLADCLLLYSLQDAVLIRRFIEEGAEWQRAAAEARLQAMLRYAQAGGCRRALLLAYFDEPFDDVPCGACDNCQRADVEEGAPGQDVTDAAQRFLKCVQATGQRFGVSYVVDVLRGSRSQKVLQQRHDRLPLYGAGREMRERQWRRLGQELIVQGLLEQDMEHGNVRLTAKGREVLAGSRRVWLVERELPAEAAVATEHDPGLFEALRSLRRQLAEADNVPPYIVFHDRTLMEMATYCPQSLERLQDIEGVGRVKLERYGEAFLAVLRQYCADHGLAERPKAVHAPKVTGGAAKRRRAEVGEMFAAGWTVEQIQAHFGVQRGTVLNHLADYLRAGGAVETDRLWRLSTLSSEQQAQVLALFHELGVERLSPVFQALGGQVPYDELHLMRLIYLAQAKGTQGPSLSSPA